MRDIVIAALAFAYCVWAIAGSGEDIVAKGFVLLLAGIPVYVGMRWWQTAARRRCVPPEPAARASSLVAAVAAGDDR